MQKIEQLLDEIKKDQAHNKEQYKQIKLMQKIDLTIVQTLLDEIKKDQAHNEERLNLIKIDFLANQELLEKIKLDQKKISY